MTDYQPETWSIEPPNDPVGIVNRVLKCLVCDGTGKDREQESCSHCGGTGTRRD